MADLMHFDYSGYHIRTLDIDGEPWFIAADVAKVLGYRMGSDMTRRLDDEDRGTRSVRTPSGLQELTTINEAGLYAAVLGSKIEGAKRFKRWVIADVLPTIRRTGGYGQPREPSRRELAEFWAEAEKRAEAAQQRTAELEPDAKAWQDLADASGDHSLREAAQILCRAGIDTGQNRLMRTLYALGWVDSKGKPYQSQVGTGRIRAKVSTFEHPHTGEPTVTTTVRITPKGLRWLHARLANQPLPLETVG